MEQLGNRNKTILVLDDEEIDRSLVRKVLQDEGYTVIEADSYASALTVFNSKKRIDLLIADISLPDGNGCELAVAAREKQQNLRVLFVSGHVGTEVCRFYGLDVTDIHFLRKPFQGKELVHYVSRVLNAVEPFPRLIPKTRTA